MKIIEFHSKSGKRYGVKKVLLPLLISVLALSTILMIGPVLAADLYEYCNSGEVTFEYVSGNLQRAQTFTPVVDHTITSVKVEIFKVGSPGNLTVAIRTTSAGEPTSTVLCSGTLLEGDITHTTYPGGWYEVSMGAGYDLVAGTMYAIVLSAPAGGAIAGPPPSTNYIGWANTPPNSSSGIDLYIGGTRVNSSIIPESWNIKFGDLMFEVWGELPNSPPDVSGAYANPDCLWPANNKVVDVNIMGVTDPDGDPVTINIIGITSDEPTATDKGSGGAKHAPDAQGIGTDTASIRAERSGNGDGRVYEITFSASDDMGGVSEGTVIVNVPHDQSESCEAIDSGQIYDATVIN